MTKTLTLTQPWATLVALGIKKVETRSWTTSYRGPLLIHAAKGWTAADRAFAQELHEGSVLPIPPADLPRGAIIARCRLDEFEPETTFSELEQELGDFSTGRFAWRLEDVVALPAPIPWRGALGLWDGPDLAGGR